MDQILTAMLASQPEISDLLFTVGRPPQVEAYGELKPVVLDPPIAQLTPYQTEMIAMNIIGDNLWQIEDLLRHGSCDASYALSDQARFRVNVFAQRGTGPGPRAPPCSTGSAAWSATAPASAAGRRSSSSWA